MVDFEEERKGRTTMKQIAGKQAIIEERLWSIGKRG